jgi:hypothetical protein
VLKLIIIHPDDNGSQISSGSSSVHRGLRSVRCPQATCGLLSAGGASGGDQADAGPLRPRQLSYTWSVIAGQGQCSPHGGALTNQPRETIICRRHPVDRDSQPI